ncbi:MAG: tetratricopeptide repeat protein [Myxococcales bacterium]|nr:tetratricopeptide repeat protein [Myxococcales bacterium]
MSRERSHRWLLFLALVAALYASSAGAQQLQDPAEILERAMAASPAELEAWRLLEQRRFIAARERAEGIVRGDSSSFVGHLTLGYAHHLGESNLPRALYHLERARSLFEGRFGERPGSDAPFLWHVQLLEGLSSVHGSMEHYGEKLSYMARFNELYEPDKIAERAWPLMKLGKLAEARLAAELGLASDRPEQHTIALNALCAIEFEAGNDDKSYAACRRAVDHSRSMGGEPSAVDLTNFAEASRSQFKLAEAERVSLEATTAPLSWYGNPWVELGELYVRQGRFGEALSALRKVPEYRERRPPHVRNADINEMRRALSSFLLVLAKAQEASEITRRGIDAPDRRAHNSRDPAQDRSVLSLLHRRALRTEAQRIEEHAATRPFYERPWAHLQAAWLRVQALRSEALTQRLLDDDRRIVGSLRLGSATSAIMPPWLLGELVEVMGAGVIGAALGRARARDGRQAAAAYFDALGVEVAQHQGQPQKALDHSRRALSALPPGEVLLAARTMALSAQAARDLGRSELARRHYNDALQRDPGVFRRLELPIAVRVGLGGGEVAETVAEMLLRSPRFENDAGGLSMRIEADRTQARVCLRGERDELIACSSSRARASEGEDAYAARVTSEALEQLFAPRIDLTQTDINSLDGTNLSGRGPLEAILGDGETSEDAAP